jgi:hypothetical protein
MLKVVLGTMLILLCCSSNAFAQLWEAAALGPGSQPGTILVEISGTPGDPGDCGPNPQLACTIWWFAIEGTISPCATVIGSAVSGCLPDGTMTFTHSAPLFERFSFQIEIQEDVAYTIEGGWSWTAYLDSGMHDCEPASQCTMGYQMNPDPLVLTAAVPVSASGWSVLKTNYRTD